MHNGVVICHQRNKYLSISCNSRDLSPLWNNNVFLTGTAPFIFPSWSSNRVNNLSDIYNQNGCSSFLDLKDTYSPSSSSRFLYLKLCSTWKTYAVSWNSQLCPQPLIHLLLRIRLNKKVPQIYYKLASHAPRPLNITNKWECDL